MRGSNCCKGFCYWLGVDLSTDFIIIVVIEGVPIVFIFITNTIGIGFDLCCLLHLHRLRLGLFGFRSDLM